MREHRPSVAHDDHRRQPFCELERLSYTGPGFDRHHFFPLTPVKVHVHGTALNHHAYDRRAKAL